MAMEGLTGEYITKFEIESDDQINAIRVLFNRISTEIRIELYRSTDLISVYYSPYRTFLELEKVWTDDLGNLLLLENIPAGNVVIYHCSSYVKNFNYKDEEIYIKTIALSKGYDLCLCTGRSSFRYNCSDFIYSDRYFDYAFGERLYWFICYSSSKDSPELIRDKLTELFGHEFGEKVLNELQNSKFFNSRNYCG
jgi:hypothetical protein